MESPADLVLPRFFPCKYDTIFYAECQAFFIINKIINNSTLQLYSLQSKIIIRRRNFRRRRSLIKMQKQILSKKNNIRDIDGRGGVCYNVLIFNITLKGE